jgi:hypothetical protein
VSAVVLDKATHTYTVAGVVVPSVTQVLRECFDFSRVDPAVLAAKAMLGTAVHKACELDDAGTLDEASVHERVLPYLEGYRLFKREKRPEVLATEQRVFHPIAGYAGTYDVRMVFDGYIWLIDWKTPLVINPAVALQLAAYTAALPPMERSGREKRGALQLLDDGRYRLHEFKDPNDYPTFLSFLNTYRWKKANLK